jgi:thioesterase domain-containing protein
VGDQDLSRDQLGDPGSVLADPHLLQKFLHERIPLSKAMGIEVVEATDDVVTLTAPLAPNVNHRDSVFGGSASAIAILSAWALIYLRLRSEQLKVRIVIQRNTMTYERPITEEFTASATISDVTAWRRFVDTVKRRGRGRFRVHSRLYGHGEKAGEFEGDFVAWIQA